MTTYAFIKFQKTGPEVVFSSKDPAEVKRAWSEYKDMALRTLTNGEIHHPTVAEAQAVYSA